MKGRLHHRADNERLVIAQDERGGERQDDGRERYADAHATIATQIEVSIEIDESEDRADGRGYRRC